jgi:parallel beta-helix repeat protein
MRRAGSIVFILLIAVFVLGSCSEDSPVADGPQNGGNGEPPPPPETIPDTAIVTIQLVSWADASGQNAGDEPPAGVDEVRFEITAADIQTQTHTVTAGRDPIEETFAIATGVARRIDVQAFNAADSLLYDGTKYDTFADSALVTAIGMVAAGDDTPPVYAGLEDAAAISGNFVLLSWQMATDGSDPDLEAVYLIYQSTQSGNFDYAYPSYTTNPGETSFLVGGLDPGTTYYFVVRAMDRAGNIGPNTAQQSATTPGAAGELYVDVNTGSDNASCGTSNSPCKTITYALTKTSGNQTIKVAKGTYNAASGETFPLQLKPGTMLDGEAYWWNGVKVIKETFIEGTTPMILGADGASIVGCYLRPTDWGSASHAIFDDGHAIYVYHCTIDGALAPGLWGVSFSGASTIRSCRVENFDHTAGRGIRVWGAGGVVINNNLVIKCGGGIWAGASDCVIMNNWVEDMYCTGIGVDIIDGTVYRTTIFRNTVKDVGCNGIDVRKTTGTKITYNSVSYTTGVGIAIGNYQLPTNMVIVYGNTITHGGSAGVQVMGGGATVTHNNIACNVAGALVRSDQVIDLRWNEWDNSPPVVDDGRGLYDPGCDLPHDICYEAGYAGTPEPLVQPDGGKGNCNIAVLPSPPKTPSSK